MGIDGIGRSGPPISPTGVGEAGGASKIGKESSVEAPESAAAAEGGSPLDKLQRGELSLDEYIDTQLQQATQHLNGVVTPQQLRTIQNVLREELSTDPALQEMVLRATGKQPGADL